MFGKLFRCNKRSRPERPSFRPTLETLESREVLSPATVRAAFFALPADVANLQASMAARPTNANTVNANIGVVLNDFTTLKLGAPAFNAGGRLQIDNALVVNGITLVYDAFLDHAFLPSTTQFVQIAQMGASAVQSGIRDALLVGFFPTAVAGTAVL